MRDSLRRIGALTKKEFQEVLRDNSSLAMGILLPIVLILIIGYGITLDVKHAPVAVVLEDASPEAQQVVDFVDGSDYFKPVYMTSMGQAQKAMTARTVDAILRVPPDFSQKLHQGDGKLQLILYGTETTTAMTIQSYVETSVARWSAQKMAAEGVGAIDVENRLWFNDANESTWYFIPGLILMIVTLIGVLLTAGVMAREYERGTFESLFVTPVKKGEIVVAKIIPYFCIAMLGVFICLILARFLFEVPLVGSLSVIILVSILYLIVALAGGLIISVMTKAQFTATHIAMLSSFLPSIMLSGFLFDLRSTPSWLQWIGEVLPFKHYLVVLKTLALAGNIWPVVLRQSGFLIVYGVLGLGLALHMIRKKVE